MKNLLDPGFIESALSDFQVIRPFATGDVFNRAADIREDTNAHLVQLNKAYVSGDIERFFALFQVILKQEQDRNE
jgi:molybdopterin/thiamine biosynthesis adenylyltransferase